MPTCRSRPRIRPTSSVSRCSLSASAHLDLPALADKLIRLTDEVGRLRGLLRQTGIEPQGGAA